MAKRSGGGSAGKPDRFLYLRDGTYYYMRRVPARLQLVDERSPSIRQSLKTGDLALARAKRDLLEEADNALWASLLLDAPRDTARARYQAAVKRVEALGFTFRSGAALGKSASLDDIIARLETIENGSLSREASKAVVGAVPLPTVTVSKAFEIYVDEIVADELVNKSQNQRAQWKKVKRRAVNNFVDLVGDKEMTEITREDAQRFYRFWLEKVAPKGRKATHSASSGNRDLGNLRVLYEAYFTHMGETDRFNPFSKLNFHEKKKRIRPPFSVEWIVGTILKPGAMQTMNDEARGVALALIETGARPSEIANLTKQSIHIDADIPHLSIEPRVDPEDPREIKTASSERKLPLIGVALEVFSRFPEGFPRYRNRENDLSATLNKYFRENGLFPSRSHTIYSFRHSFEDRMKIAGLDPELRMILMGHTIDRPRYGAGGTMEWRQNELKKIALPFDPAIV
ncbi:DUF6538 domain-containing protein [Nitratireductor indicus]|nr:DUF6538 domain-containing protein [Nitratireductor indicus]SFQ11932.1 Phage integrase family protein [Nitratireductor indicus]